MTITSSGLLLYIGALFILWATPGPVWVAIIARSISSGVKGAWPLALGVSVGDVIWPLVAILGVSYLVSIYADIMIALRYFAAFLLAMMGTVLVRWPDKVISTDNSLTAPGIWAGFLAGLAAVIANPKAVLFYMTLLPSFFNFTTITSLDIVVICISSAIVPFLGNISLSLFVDQIRRFLASPVALRRTNIAAGLSLIGVGIFIAIKA